MGETQVVAGCSHSVEADRIPAVIRVSALRKEYGKQSAIAGISLEVQKGEIYGLIGPDGAGKSSLMKIVAGVLTFDAGEIEVFGVSLNSDSNAERIKDRIGFMPQGLGLNLYPDLSIEENIDFFANLRLVQSSQLTARKQKLLEMTHLEAFRARPMKQLSGGMKQKLGLICSLIHEPKLLVLDEPTTGVDPVSRRDFWAILGVLLKEHGTTALVSTAYMDEATRFHRVALLFGGQVVAQGAPEEIQQLVPARIVAITIPSPAVALSRLRAEFPQIEALGSLLQVFVEDKAGLDARARVVRVLGDVKPARVETMDPQLEDVFIALLRIKKLTTEPDRTSTLPAAPVSNPTQPKTPYAIEAKELVRDFGGFKAVNKVSFRVAPGEIFGLLGANGAGKTTVIKMLTGILPPTAGSGSVAGADMQTAGRKIKERIGYMSQAFSLYLDLTVEENIKLYAGIYGLPASVARERFRWVVQMAGLEGRESKAAQSLPMGLRQRLALGCALVHRPQILFLDEPTSGVDPVGRRRFWEILFTLAREEGVAILVTTHYMNEAEHCDHLALMFAGRVVADASPSDMKSEVERQSGKLVEIDAVHTSAALDLLVKAGFKGSVLFGSRIHVFSKDVPGDTERIKAALSEDPARSILPRSLTMEDVFVERVMALEQAVETTKNGAVS